MICKAHYRPEFCKILRAEAVYKHFKINKVIMFLPDVAHSSKQLHLAFDFKVFNTMRHEIFFRVHMMLK